MISCQKCHKSDPGARTVRELLELRLYCTRARPDFFAAAAIHGSSLHEGDERRQMLYCEL
eukprot:3464449-Prymnesium_polylepis.2